MDQTKIKWENCTLYKGRDKLFAGKYVNPYVIQVISIDGCIKVRINSFARKYVNPYAIQVISIDGWIFNMNF